jgi:S1-C subfamily serine protease
MDGRAFDDQHPFLNRVLEHQPRDRVTLDVLRHGEILHLEVVLGDRPSA